MIHFSCFQCGLKFKVKDEFAGKASKCPSCKSSVKVLDRTVAAVPTDKVDGSASSLHQAGIDAGVTLPPSVPSRSVRKPSLGSALVAPAATKSVADALSQQASAAGRYLLEGEIARGGMGAVLRGIDRDIRREVAIKFMLDDRDPKKKARFVEEAQITGQLEHPWRFPSGGWGRSARRSRCGAPVDRWPPQWSSGP